MNFVKKIFIITVILFGQACTPFWYAPQGHLLFSQVPKGGSPGYTLGWKHGCESGAGTQFGGAVYMTFYTWHRDVDITSTKPNIPLIRQRYKKELAGINWNDPADIKRNFDDYNMVFWDAHLFCRQTVLGALQPAGMNPVLPGEERYDPAAHSIGSVWKLTAKGDTRWGTG